jgi:hypothetical protein
MRILIFFSKNLNSPFVLPNRRNVVPFSHLINLCKLCALVDIVTI